MKWCKLSYLIYLEEKVYKYILNEVFVFNFNNPNNSNDVILVFAYFQLIKI